MILQTEIHSNNGHHSKGLTEDEAERLLNDEPVEKINLDFETFLRKAKQAPPMKRIFGDFIHSNELCLLAGKTGTGKSILAYTLADGWTRGHTEIMGQASDLTEPTPVLYFDLELNQQQIAKRFHSYEPAPLLLRPDFDELLKRYDEFSFEIIAKIIEEAEIKPKIVILDNLSAISLRALQDQETALDLIKQAKALKSKYDLTLIIVHHTPKISDNKELNIYDIAGSANIHNFIDSAIIINKSIQDTDLRYCKPVKSRSAAETDRVLTLQIAEAPFLHYSFLEFSKETEHLKIDEKREQARTEKLQLLANKCLEDALTYSELVAKIADLTNTSRENGKKQLHKLLNNDIITKNYDNKYILNRNEYNF